MWYGAHGAHVAHALTDAPGYGFNDALLPFLSPLGWEHINLKGDYVWSPAAGPKNGAFRTLRDIQNSQGTRLSVSGNRPVDALTTVHRQLLRERVAAYAGGLRNTTSAEGRLR